VLLESGASVSATDNAGGTPLFDACYNRHSDVVELLLSNGSNVNAVDLNGFSPLHIAASIGSFEVAQILVESGADINLKNQKCLAPIIYSIHKKHLQVSRYLLIKGAEIGEEGQDPKDIAAQYSFDFDFILPLLKERFEKRKRKEKRTFYLFVCFDEYFCVCRDAERSRSSTGEEMDEEQKRLWKTGVQLFNSKGKKGKNSKEI
jgi:hypothetical protein